MGLFSSKKKTSVGTAVTRVVEDKFLPNSVLTGSVDSVFNGTPFTETILDELTSNIGAKAQHFYKYAEKHYPYGLPGKTHYSTLVGEKEARNVLLGILGMHVSIRYSFISSKNPMHFAWEHLVNQYGYDSRSNILKNLVHPNGDVYLYDMVYELGKVESEQLEPNVFEIYGRAASAGHIPRHREFMDILGDMVTPTPPLIKKGSSPEIIRVTTATLRTPSYSFFYKPPTLVTEEIIFNVSDVAQDRDGDFLHVGYVDASGKLGFWSYELGLGTYPHLDALVHNPNPVTGKYFPFTYFRYNKTREGRNKETQAYKVSKRMLNMLSMDYQELIDAIHDNPDIGDVEQAMMVFTVPANAKSQIELRYVYDFFNDWYGRQAYGRSTLNASISTLARWRFGNVPPVDVTEVRDRRFRMALSHKGISKRLRAGKIGPVGFITLHRGSFTYTKKVEDDDSLTGGWVKIYFPTHVYRKQISGNMYEELEVLDLKHTYYIWRGHNVIADEGNPILHIPIDMELLKGYSLPDREALYSRSLHFVFNSRVTRKVKWYQRGIFKALLTVAAIALVVFTQGASLAAWASALAAGGAAASAALISLMKTILVGLVISYGAKVVAQRVGIEFALVLAAVAIAAGAVDIIQAESLSSSMWAGDLLTVSNSLIEASAGVVQKDLIGLQNEFEDFYSYAREATKTLEEANELLYSSPILTPFTFIGESPQDYYNRSVRLLNPGLESIRAISNYAEYSLRLPTFTDTIQEFRNEFTW